MADQMKITELGVDCLEHIFKKLEFIDLVNVADASKHFKQAVDLAYAYKYGKMKTVVQIYKAGQLYRVESNEITVYDSLVSLRLLRCFGHLIRNLRISYQGKHQPHLDDYISEYCANSLNEIGLYYPTKEALGNLTKPFAKCEKVDLFAIHSDNKFTDFNQWFPQMRSLELFNSMIGTAILSYIDKPFPNLVELLIGSGSFRKEVSYIEKNVFNVLRWNPQLRRLEVYDSLSGDFLQSISAHLQRVETLSIDCDGLSDDIDGVFHFERVKELTLCEYQDFPLSCPQLQMLTIIGRYYDTSESNILAIIHQHRSTLVKVTVERDAPKGRVKRMMSKKDPFEDLDKKDVAVAMELLIDIDLPDTVFTINEAIEFLNICKQLKKFRFKLAKKDDVAKFNDSLKSIGGGWNLSTESNGRILLQR